MHYFFAEYDSMTTISILKSNGDVQASRDVYISKESFVTDLTENMIELSHEQNLYHNDILAIGVVVDAETALGKKSQGQLQNELEVSFGFTAVVDSDKNAVKETLLQGAK